MEAAAPLRLKDALDLMEAAPTFSVRFVKADRRRKKAGEIVVLPVARLATRRSGRSGPAPAPPASATPATRRARHYRNATRNLVDVRTGRIIKAHIYLLIEIEGRPVLI